MANTTYFKLKTQEKETINATSQEILPEREHRNYLLLQNLSNQPISIAIGDGPAVLNEGIVINAGGVWEPVKAPREAVHAIAPSTNKILLVTEGES